MKNKNAISFCFCFVSILLFIVLPKAAFASTQTLKTDKPLALSASSAILLERDTGEILYEKNPHQKLPPASMVKMMTLLLVMEQIDQGKLKKDEFIRVSEHAASMGGSQIFLETGEKMSVEDLLKAVAVASGNDASVALAERIAGSEEAFVKEMNQKAAALQLNNTVFKNATGLPVDGQYSTAYDMGIIAKELLKYEDITTYTSIYEDYLRKGKDNEFWLVNTNKLVRFYPEVDGLKTGYTSEAKYCLTATAKKNDMRVVSVVMGAESIKDRNKMTADLLDYAFHHYQTNQLYKKGENIKQIHDIKADKQNINIVTPQSIRTIYKKDKPIEHTQTKISIEEPLTFPVQKGEQVGTLEIRNNKDVLTKAPLVVDRNIHKASYITLVKRTLQNMSKIQ